MSSDIQSGWRHEHKYIEPEINLVSIEKRLVKVMKRDPHVPGSGYYSVRSLYFDDYDNRYLDDNVNGLGNREKWRIRIYNADSGRISLECKMKWIDLVAKKSCTISISTFNKIMDRSAKIDSDNPALLNRFITEMQTRYLRPSIIVEYERTPFVCHAGNTRVTIDRNIRSSSDIDSFLEGRINARSVLLKGQNLIEVKYDAFLPDHLAHTIEHGRMRRETFSKYYLARKFTYKGLT